MNDSPILLRANLKSLQPLLPTGNPMKLTKPPLTAPVSTGIGEQLWNESILKYTVYLLCLILQILVLLRYQVNTGPMLPISIPMLLT